MRKLASIQRIISIDEISGYDRIALATVLGWKVIIQKNEFKVNDLCIYIEPDSILPDKPEFEFLRKRCWSPQWNGHRIRVMKMAGVVSYGIVFPLDLLSSDHGKFKEGQDVTKLMGIVKYDPELLIEQRNVNERKLNFILRFLFRFEIFRKLFRKRKHRNFPSHLITKTDESRVQNLPHVLKDFKGARCSITEKIDGQSGSFLYNKRKFYVCSRNLIVENRSSNYWKIAGKYDIEKKLKKYPENIGIQGEIVGGTIQGNKYRIDGLEFYVFNVWLIDRQRYMSLKEIQEFCNQYEFKTVPLLDDNFILDHTVDELIELSKGCSVLNKDTLREGIVIRDIENKNQAIRGVGQTLSFKVVNPEFLLKYGD